MKKCKLKLKFANTAPGSASSPQKYNQEQITYVICMILPQLHCKLNLLFLIQ